MLELKSSSTGGGLIYVPSPVNMLYNFIYSIEENNSGRLQYYRQPANRKRMRITKTEFSKVYNQSNILAIEPVQKNISDSATHFLLKFYTL